MSATTVSQAVAERDAAPAKVTPKEALRQLLDAQRAAVGASLPTGFSQDRFVRLLLTAANTNPELFDCDPRSFLAAGVGAAQLGLEPNDARGLAYLVPFKVQGKKKVQLIIGYRGMLDLARRSGMVSSISAFPVYQGDRFEYQFGLEPTLVHVPNPDGDEDPTKLTHVYAVAKVAGDPQFVVLTRRQIDRTKASSQGAKSSYSPWQTYYVEMALKTALRRLCKWLPQTVEVAQALDHDERDLVIGDLGVIGHGDTRVDDEDVIDAAAIEAPKDVTNDGEITNESGTLLDPETGA